MLQVLESPKRVRKHRYFPTPALVCYTAAFSVITQRALRDDAKNGCVADYATTGLTAK